MEKSKDNKHHINLMLSDSDYEYLLGQEEMMKIKSHTKVIRTLIRDGFCYKIDYGGLYAVATQISRIGNNINQVARVANETGTVSDYQIQELKENLKKVEKIVNDEIHRGAKLIRYRDWYREHLVNGKLEAGDTDGSNEDNQD